MKGKSSALAPFVKSTTMARAEARRLSLGDLEKLVSILDKTLASERTKVEKKQSEERTATIKKVNALLAENGLQPTDLNQVKARPKRKAKAKSDVKSKAKKTAKTRANNKAKTADKPAASTKHSAAKKPAKRKTVPPRYRLDIDGREYLWSGRGRTPKIFQAYFDAGNSRESCEIAE
tara:strand:+ start:1409 stop:1939 length:531 start_codon:yes stop_codon:yes gene_type:complete